VDAQRFDAWTRRLRSRRAVFPGLAGGLATMLHLTTADDAGAKPKRCPNGKKRCGKRCIPKRTPCCKAGRKRCGKRCIRKNQCCTTADCGARRLCVNNVCIIGQGTCAAGANGCFGFNDLTTCKPSMGPYCFCFQTTAGTTRCGRDYIGACGACLDDADCAKNHPGVPGAFCIQSGPSCLCNGSTTCMLPCPG
jgi:hypothetical protein